MQGEAYRSACNEVEQYDKMVAYFFPKELKPQNRFYDKMMDVAVEYEESGFMAGYRMCLKHLQEQEQQAQTDTTNSIPEEPKRQEQADTGSVDASGFHFLKTDGRNVLCTKRKSRKKN